MDCQTVASGFSVCFIWSVTEGLAKQQKNKNKPRRKKTKVVQGPELPDLPALNLASSEDDLVSAHVTHYLALS